MDRSLTGGWRRNAEAETRLQRMGVRCRKTSCYACLATDQRPAAALWFQTRGLEELFVSNIVPQGKRVLTDDEYNLILSDFEANVLLPASKDLELDVALVRKRVRLEVSLSPEAVRRLEAFSADAKKENLGRQDHQRWREFVVQAHLERAAIDPMLLDQWFADQGWSEAKRQELLDEYESTRSVLAAYDEERL